MIDLHMIRTPDYEGFDDQAKRASHPKVTIVEGDYVKGNMLEARMKAYAKGSNPYVSWIDDDDIVLDMSWIDSALEMLEDKSIAAVYPQWRARMNDKIVHQTTFRPWNISHHESNGGSPEAHHLTIMRRENVLELLEQVKAITPVHVKSQDRLLTTGMWRYGKVVPIEALAYEWLLRPNSARSLPENRAVSAWAESHMTASREFAKKY